MYNVIHNNKLIAKVGRKSGIGATFHFPFDEENGYQIFKIDGINYYVNKLING